MVDACLLVVDVNVVEGAEVDVVEVVDVDDGVDDEAGSEVVVADVVAGGSDVDEVEVELDEVLAGGSVDVEVVVTTEGGSDVEVALLVDEVVGATDVGSAVVVGATDVVEMDVAAAVVVVSAAVVVVAAATEVKLELPLPPS